MSPIRKPVRKPSAAVKDFMDVDKQGSRLLGPIDKHLMSRPLDMSRRTDVLHPSELCSDDWCHRASYFLLKGEVYPASVKRDSAHLQRIFEEGHAIHRKYQTWISDMGDMYGVWRCLQCGAKSWARGGQKFVACARCNGVLCVYDEVPVQSADHHISGAADGWVLDHGSPYLIEIKSVGTGTLRFEAPQLLAKHDGDLDAVWKDIRRPFKKHRLQGQLYLALLEIMEAAGTLVLPEGYARPEEIVFVYEFKPNQQSKEFVVGYDAEDVADILDTALDVVYAVSKDSPPDCNVSDGGCGKCRPFDPYPSLHPEVRESPIDVLS